jgi:hypothetical protein
MLCRHEFGVNRYVSSEVHCMYFEVISLLPACYSILFIVNPLPLCRKAAPQCPVLGQQPWYDAVDPVSLAWYGTRRVWRRILRVCNVASEWESTYRTQSICMYVHARSREERGTCWFAKIKANLSRPNVKCMQGATGHVRIYKRSLIPSPTPYSNHSYYHVIRPSPL